MEIGFSVVLEIFLWVLLTWVSLLVNNWRGRGVWFLPKWRIYTSLISIIKTKNIATVNSLLSDGKKISGLIFHDNKKKEIHFLLQDKMFIIPNIRWYIRFRNWKKKQIDKLEQLSQKLRASQLLITFNTKIPTWISQCWGDLCFSNVWYQCQPRDELFLRQLVDRHTVQEKRPPGHPNLTIPTH